MKLYVPVAALLGMLMVAVRPAEPPLGTVIGLAGNSVQIAAERALASQFALILPLKEFDDVSVKFAVPCPPGAKESDCVPEIE